VSPRIHRYKKKKKINEKVVVVNLNIKYKKFGLNQKIALKKFFFF